MLGLQMEGNGTKNRHLMTSLIGSMEMSTDDRDLVYELFGHSEHVNRNVYQAPAAERHLHVTGKILTKIDQG